MGDEDLIGQSRDEVVALGGLLRGGAVLGFAEGREDEQAVLLQARAPGRGYAHGMDGPGRADDDGLVAAEEEGEAFFFHGRLETADGGHSISAETAGEVVGLEDQVAGALHGAEEGE